MMKQHVIKSDKAAHRGFRKAKVSMYVLPLGILFFATVALSQIGAHDPGPRSDKVDSGNPLPGLNSSPGLAAAFADGKQRFQVIETVQGGTNNGLGPRFNALSCAGCHAQPSVGGSSPSATVYPNIGANPQASMANYLGAKNEVPSFISGEGPVREVRFPYFMNTDGTVNTSAPDGGVHDLYVISGRSDGGNCNITQPNFAQYVSAGDVSFRIPTPTYGEGLIENISDGTILANMNSNTAAKQALGIAGEPNTSGNDGTITKFGWKAQNKSLEIFAGEAYNVEMGVTNELFTNERVSPGDPPLPKNCLMNPTPEDTTNSAARPDSAVSSDVVAFAMFMRLLAPPKPSATMPGGATSIQQGEMSFSTVGCAFCHTPQMTTQKSSFVPALSNVQANLFSDLLIHHMGSGLADNVSQGGAGPDQFRTAPLWGLGQRVFFLHDGRTNDLMQAILAHSSPGSEANAVVAQFQKLSATQQQDLLNFLRSR